MKTIAYVDGFNFFYACCKGTPHKWINLLRVVQLALPNHNIVKVYYFTAKVKAKPYDPSKLERQRQYWRALATVPEIEIVYGHYSENIRVMQKAEHKWIKATKKWLCRWPRLRPYMAPGLVKVIKAEEKRSDVNLATRLIIGACDDAFECAAVLSNDSDLLEPIRQVRGKFKKTVGLLCARDKPSKDLNGHVDFFRYLDPSDLKKALFDDTMTDAKGKFTKPTGW
ncbi:MAG: NYN domain-containing protein [Opitutaceae bacterium]|nr:NYN domain-containing protein [Opitutaceae bacterium]